MSQVHGRSVHPTARARFFASSPSFLRLVSYSGSLRVPRSVGPLSFSPSSLLLSIPVFLPRLRLPWRPHAPRFGPDGNPSIPLVSRTSSIQTVPGYNRDNEKALSPHSEELVESVPAHCASRHYPARGNLETATPNPAFFEPRALEISLARHYVNNGLLSQ